MKGLAPDLPPDSPMMTRARRSTLADGGSPALAASPSKQAATAAAAAGSAGGHAEVPPLVRARRGVRKSSFHVRTSILDSENVMNSGNIYR